MNPWEHLNYSCNQSYILWSGLSICNQWHQAVSTENCWFWKVCFAHIVGSHGLSQAFAEEHFWQHVQNCPSVTLKDRQGVIYESGNITRSDLLATFHHTSPPLRISDHTFRANEEHLSRSGNGGWSMLVGAFQFSEWTSALHSFFPRVGGDWIQSCQCYTAIWGVLYDAMWVLFSLASWQVYSKIWFLRCLCPCVCGCGGRWILFRSSNWSFDQFSPNISHLAVQKGEVASKACKLITWGQFDYIAICKEWGGGVRRWGKIVL